MTLYGSQKAFLEFEFFGEVGTGLGPTLEFYTLVSKVCVLLLSSNPCCCVPPLLDPRDIATLDPTPVPLMTPKACPGLKWPKLVKRGGDPLLPPTRLSCSAFPLPKEAGDRFFFNLRGGCCCSHSRWNFVCHPPGPASLEAWGVAQRGRSGAVQEGARGRGGRDGPGREGVRAGMPIRATTEVLCSCRRRSSLCQLDWILPERVLLATVW